MQLFTSSAIDIDLGLGNRPNRIDNDISTAVMWSYCSLPCEILLYFSVHPACGPIAFVLLILDSFLRRLVFLMLWHCQPCPQINFRFDYGEDCPRGSSGDEPRVGDEIGSAVRNMDGACGWVCFANLEEQHLCFCFFLVASLLRVRLCESKLRGVV